MNNPFRSREHWGHWAIALVVGGALAVLLMLVLSKLGGYSNRPDVERAMEPPPKEAPPEAPAAR